MDGYFPRGRNTAIRDKYLHLINSKRRVGGEYYKVHQRSCVRSSTVETKLGRGGKESFSPATLFASRQRSGPREVERDSRVGKLFLANSICQMETKRYSGIALNNTALLLPAESLSLSLLFSSSLSISTLEFLDQGGIRTKASLLFRILINI